MKDFNGVCVVVVGGKGSFERNHNVGRPHQKETEETAMKEGLTGRWLKKLQLRKTDRNHNKRGPGFIDDKNYNGGPRRVIEGIDCKKV